MAQGTGKRLQDRGRNTPTKGLLWREAYPENMSPSIPVYEDEWTSCSLCRADSTRENMAHMTQSWPDSRLSLSYFRATVFKTHDVVDFSRLSSTRISRASRSVPFPAHIRQSRPDSGLSMSHLFLHLSFKPPRLFPGTLSGTHKTLTARLWPWLEPFFGKSL